MAERSKYEAFLIELDKGGDSKPAHVVAKVKADYTAKLTEVIERLKANHDVLTQHAAALTAQLQKLEQEERGILDEQAEAEIRKQVGELSEADWLVSSKKAEARIIKLKESQQLTTGDINRIRGILGASVAPGAPSAPGTDSAVPAKSVTDELAFLKSVVGTTGALPKAPPPAPTPRSTAPTVAPRATAAKPVVPRPSVTQSAPAAPRPSQVQKAPVERLIEPDPMDVQAPPPEPPAAKPVAPPMPRKEELIVRPQADVKINAKNTDERPMASNVPDGDLQLKARGVPGAKKTLKCKECGALNNPSEWYCERCGAELTNL